MERSMKSTKELVGASTAIIVLSALAAEPSYGYELVQRINTQANGAFVWQEGTIYPLLHKLEKTKLIRAQWQQADTGRERKYYYITAKGRTAIQEEAKQFSLFHELVTHFVGQSKGAIHHG
jgi:DNA-binding PadR family transcriptional regulator